MKQFAQHRSPLAYGRLSRASTQRLAAQFWLPLTTLIVGGVARGGSTKPAHAQAAAPRADSAGDRRGERALFADRCGGRSPAYPARGRSGSICRTSTIADSAGRDLRRRALRRQSVTLVKVSRRAARANGNYTWHGKPTVTRTDSR